LPNRRESQREIFAIEITSNSPVTERVAAEILSLPMFPQLTTAQQKEVAGAVMQFIASNVGYSR